MIPPDPNMQTFRAHDSQQPEPATPSADEPAEAQIADPFSGGACPALSADRGADQTGGASTAAKSQEMSRFVPECPPNQNAPPSETSQLHAKAKTARVPVADELLVRLTGPQQMAIGLLAQGKTDQTVAGILAVNPKTIARWRLYHVGFRAELARRQQEVWGAVAEQLRGMMTKALQVLAEGMSHHDQLVKFRAARGLLMLARRFAPPDVPIDPVAVLEQHARLIHQSFKSTDGAVEPLDELDITWAERDLIHKLEGGAGMPRVETDGGKTGGQGDRVAEGRGEEENK
jgi:hypothetical protein